MSTLSLRKIKHDSSAVDNITLDSSGNTSISKRLEIQQDSTSNNRIVLRGQPGSSYRYSIDNNSNLNVFRVFRENDADGSSGVEYFKLDSAGRVTIPSQPAFAVTLNSNISAGAAAQVIPMNNAIINVGSCYNTTTYRFTAPVNGSYQIQFKWESISGTAPTYSELYIRKNGSNYVYAISKRDSNSTEYTGFFGRVMYLNAGDYVDTYYNAGGGVLAGELYTVFSGYLIG